MFIYTPFPEKKLCSWLFTEYISLHNCNKFLLVIRITRALLDLINTISLPDHWIRTL